MSTSHDGERQCLRCGATFMANERRGDGEMGYNGYYCSEHDSI